MTKKHLLTIGVTLILGIVLLAGCPRKKPAATQGKPASSQKPAPAAGGRIEPEVRVDPSRKPQERTGDQMVPPDDSGPLFPDDIDDPQQPPDYNFERQASGAARGKSGSISGKIMLGERTQQNGNLFIYIPDVNSVNKENPRALASQVITADRIRGGMAEFTITGVPPGNHMILALWDISEPHCDVTQSFCAIFEGRDRLGQSDLVEVRAGLKTQGVLITLTSNEMM